MMGLKVDRKRIIFYLWAILAWVLSWLVGLLFSKADNFLLRIPNELWRGAYLLFISFFFLEYTWPFIKQKRKFLIYNILLGIFFGGLLFGFLSEGVYRWRQLGSWLRIYTSLSKDTPEQVWTYQAVFACISFVYFSVLKHLYDYHLLKLSTQQLRLEKQNAELSFLKSQTNPHFLFNTLNNIYSLTRDKSDLAPEALLRLSKILRFMLYETSEDFIQIDREIKIISDYIELEKLRYDESLDIKFTQQIDDGGQMVPPLLLIALVENAFKHGVSETRGYAFIHIHLSINENRMSFIVRNSTEMPDDAPLKENIGLSNLRRQLELLYRDYTLSVEPYPNEFIVNLRINLQSHV